MKNIFFLLLFISSICLFSQSSEKFVVAKPWAIGGGINYASDIAHLSDVHFMGLITNNNLNLRYRFNKNWTVRLGIETQFNYKNHNLHTLKLFAGLERNFFLKKKTNESGQSRLYIYSQLSYFLSGLHKLGEWDKAELMGSGVGYEYFLNPALSLRSEFGVSLGYFRRFKNVLYYNSSGYYTQKQVYYSWLWQFGRGISLELNYNFGIKQKIKT